MNEHDHDAAAGTGPELEGSPLEGSELDGAAPAREPDPAVDSSMAAPPPPPADDDFWGDRAEPRAAPASTTAPTAEGGSPSWRKWLAIGVGVAAIAGGVGFGISAVTNNSSVANAVAGTNRAGGPGGRGPNGQGAPGLVGTISAVNGSTITVKDQGGNATTVVTPSSTAVTKNVSASVSDIKVGDLVTVTGSGSSSSITATSVHDNGTPTNANANGPAGDGGPGGNGGHPPGAQTGNSAFVTGTVSAVNGSSFTVTDASGAKVTVTTSSSTTITKDQTVSLSSLAVGDTVAVQGTSSNGTVTATAIHDGVRAGGPGGLGGPGALGGLPGGPGANGGAGPNGGPPRGHP